MNSLTIPVAASGVPAVEAARRCAREAGELAAEQFKRPMEVMVKGRGNLLTQTDLRVEALITERLAAEFPDHDVLSEETASETDTDGWVWVVDPLDGTRNFVSGIPFFCVNIALCYNGEPVVGVTHDPNLNETFWAERGQGAWVNGERARVSRQETVPDSVLGFGLGYGDQQGKDALLLLHELYPGVQTLRNMGSAALGLAYTARSRFDLFFLFDVFPWDLAAGILLVREAGGVVTERDGQPATIESKAVIAGGRKVHGNFHDWLQEHGKEPDRQREG